MRCAKGSLAHPSLSLQLPPHSMLLTIYIYIYIYMALFLYNGIDNGMESLWDKVSPRAVSAVSPCAADWLELVPC